MNTKPEERFLQSLKEGVPGTSMPPWGKRADRRAAQGVLALRLPELRERAAPAAEATQGAGYRIRSPYAQNPWQRGEAIFLQRCTGCHGRKADGKGPNSLDISPRPRNLRNSAFINSVNDHRLFESITYGVEGTAMPSWMDYGLSQNDVGDIVNYIRSLNQKPAQLHRTTKRRD